MHRVNQYASKVNRVANRKADFATNLEWKVGCALHNLSSRRALNRVKRTDDRGKDM
jgi:hypothetical protein